MEKQNEQTAKAIRSLTRFLIFVFVATVLFSAVSAMVITTNDRHFAVVDIWPQDIETRPLFAPDFSLNLQVESIAYSRFHRYLIVTYRLKEGGMAMVTYNSDGKRVGKIHVHGNAY